MALSAKNTAAYAAVDVLSHRRGAEVLAALASGTMRFGELKDAIPGIGQKTLTAALRTLESEELLTRKVYAVIPPKVEYTLTQAGSELVDILWALRRWQEKYRPAEGKE